MYCTDNFDFTTTDLAAFAVEERQYLSPTTKGARLRVSTFEFNTGAGITVANYDGNGVANTAMIALAVLPKRAKVLQIYYDHEAMGTNADLDIGLFDKEGVEVDQDLFVTADDVSAAGTNLLHGNISRTAGEDLYETTEEVVLTAAAYTADWAADKDLKGYVVWVENT